MNETTQTTRLNYVEHTGNFTRVGIMCEEVDEVDAIHHAEEILCLSYAWVDMMTWGFEIVFEA
jgi:hypothetical protein